MFSRIKFLIIALMAVLLLACSRGPQLPQLPPNGVILAFGDSLTYGTGAPPGLSYPAVLAQLSGRRVVNAGVPGEVTAGGLARLAEALEEHQPQLLILCLGGNDMLRKLDLAEAEQNLQQMVEISRAHNVPVLLLGVPRPALLGMESAPLYGELAKRLKVPLEEDILSDVLSDRALKSDPIHPNAAGYRLIAEAVHEKLRSSGAL